MKKTLILSLTCIFFLAGCSSNYSNDSYDYESEYETETPYDSESGHSAGYEWAESTGGDCSGNSDSFNEGCEEYYNQESENYEEELDY